MTTKDFLISNWPVHRPAVALAAAIVAGFVIQRRAGRCSSGRALLFLSIAVAILLLSLDSPLEALADGYLFSAHMLQHLLLLLVIPAFLLFAFDNGAERASWPGKPQKKRGPDIPHPLRWQWPRALPLVANPVVTWLAGVGSMWFWHVPTLCNAATSKPTVRAVQTLSLLALGVLFWLPILGSSRSRRLPPLGGVLYLFTACIGCTLLGIILTFAPVSVCSVYLHPVDKLGVLPLIRNHWGLTPALDQQIGGLLMWVPACLIYLCGIIGLLARWYATPETEHAGGSQSAVEPTTA